jgi:hypothetical protein
VHQWDNDTDPFIQDLAGPGNLSHSTGGILIESRSSRTPAQEGPY